jgi:predicted DsbA family dithiol-disulfide isomerase
MKRVITLLCFVLLSLLPVVASDDVTTNQAPSSPLVIAEVDGVNLTLADFEARRPTGLFQARNNFYEAERKAVDEFINEYLLNREAQKQGITPEQLLERHINEAGFKQPSEETLRVYYEGVDTTEPYEAVRDKILEAIRTRRIARARTAYFQELRKQANIVFLIPPPRAPISMTGVPVRGAKDAPVSIVEFADYECPYCQQIEPVLEKLLADYQGKVSFGFKDFALPMHTNAQKAAEAAHCAQDQGKYYELHDLLFTVRQYEVSQLKEQAKTLKLNVEEFNKCLDSGSKSDLVKKQFEEAQALGLPGTPAFFVNGRLINPNGTVSYSTLQQLIDEELTASARGKHSVAAVVPAEKQK